MQEVEWQGQELSSQGLKHEGLSKSTADARAVDRSNLGMQQRLMELHPLA